MKYYAINNSVLLSKIEDTSALRNALHLDEDISVFKALEDAITFVKENPTEDKEQAFPIFEVTFAGTKGRHPMDFGTVQGFIVTPNDTKQFTVSKAIISHIDAKFQDIDLTAKDTAHVKEKEAAAPIVIADDKKDETAPKTEDKKEETAPKAEDKKEDAASKAEDKKEDAAPKVEDKKEDDVAAKAEDTSYSIFNFMAIGTTLGAISFWLTNLYPHAIALLADAGLVLPAASLATQIALPIVFGLAFASVIGVVSYAFNRLFSDSKSDTRTEDQKYHAQLKLAEELVKETSEKLVSDKDKDFLSEFTKIIDLEHTVERTFDDNGALTQEQPEAIDKLVALKYELFKLSEVAALEGDARVAKEAQTLEAAKADAAKKFAIQ